MVLAYSTRGVFAVRHADDSAQEVERLTKILNFRVL